MHTQRSMVIPNPWLVTNLTMYDTSLTCAATFGIGNSLETVKLGLLAESHA